MTAIGRLLTHKIRSDFAEFQFVRPGDPHTDGPSCPLGLSLDDGQVLDTNLSIEDSDHCPQGQRVTRNGENLLYQRGNPIRLEAFHAYP